MNETDKKKLCSSNILLIIFLLSLFYSFCMSIRSFVSCFISHCFGLCHLLHSHFPLAFSLMYIETTQNQKNWILLSTYFFFLFLLTSCLSSFLPQNFDTLHTHHRLGGWCGPLASCAPCSLFTINCRCHRLRHLVQLSLPGLNLGLQLLHSFSDL